MTRMNGNSDNNNNSGNSIIPRIILGAYLLFIGLPLPLVIGILIAISIQSKKKKRNQSQNKNQNQNTRGPAILHADSLNNGQNNARQMSRSADSVNTYYRATSLKNTAMASLNLPKQASKRLKMIKRFNTAYGLNLTSEQMSRIVDASYMSIEWAKELVSMTAEYETSSSWYAGEHAWLRAYLKAFQIQNISSDFEMQKRIVFDSFDRVFSDICDDPTQPIERAIARINTKYPILFDEVSFTIAYRFLEAHGKKYPVSFSQVFSMSDDIDSLLSKYSQAGTADSKSQRGTLQSR